MTSQPHLSPRAITAYNRLSREVAALNYLTRFAKPSGTLGEEGRAQLNRTLRIANRLYRREPEMPSFGWLDPAVPLTSADLVLIVARLSVACFVFEERYHHLTEAGRLQNTLRQDPDGLPSPHA